MLLLVETDIHDARVLRSTIRELDGLALADEPDIGGDPYNNTGQHCVIDTSDD